LTLLLLSSFAVEACEQRDRSVRFFRSESYTFSAAEQRRIEEIASATVREVQQLLPGLPERIQLTVRPGSDVIKETGETAEAMPPDAIMWTVDPQRKGGVEAVTQKWLRATLFHELHHLARAASQPRTTLVDQALYEGLATVFERDAAKEEVPWGAYPANVAQWAEELTRLPSDSSVRDWLYAHPDGRRWIGIKVGAYWVDNAVNKSGRSIRDLTTASTEEVLALAGIEPPR
jgi:uncharacterized protein YjaZ